MKELAAIFFRLGVTSFGGPAAHIAMMEEEFVRRRRWLSSEEFLDLIGAANLIPGPTSTEVAMHVGMKRAGWPGFMVAGLCFILPAILMVTAIAWFYMKFGTIPAAVGILLGVRAVIVAVIAQALWSLGRSALKSRFLWAIAGAAFIANILAAHEIMVLFGAGIITMLPAVRREKQMTVFFPAFAIPAAAATTFGLWPLFLFFLKIGSVLFGSGYVLIAFIRADLVERLGWLTETQLLDAVAVGQITPGPLFTTATFIGYVLGGPAGAFAATLGIFLPAFVFVAISAPLIPHLRKSALASAFLDGVNAAAVALIAVVVLFLARPAVTSPLMATMTIVSALLLVRWRINSAWLILAGGSIGAALL